jgi:hypothetical protein
MEKIKMNKTFFKILLNNTSKKIDYNTYLLGDYYIILESKGCIITKDLDSIIGENDEYISYKDFYKQIKKGVNQDVVSKKI